MLAVGVHATCAFSSNAPQDFKKFLHDVSRENTEGTTIVCPDKSVVGFLLVNRIVTEIIEEVGLRRKTSI